MSINRYNYQEFFLLYADNELEAADKKLVEDFIGQHPDLAEELNMLRQTILIPEQDVIFDNKELLFQFDGTENFIHPGNFEELAVSCIDNELSETDKTRLEQFIVNNPDFQKEFKLIQSLKLVADDSLIFPGKDSLYRTEKETVRVMFPWRRVAAAAIILLFAGTIWYNKRPASQVSPDVVEIIQPALPSVPGVKTNEKAVDKQSSETVKRPDVLAQINADKSGSLVTADNKIYSSNNKKDVKLKSSLKPVTSIEKNTSAQNTKNNVEDIKTNSFEAAPPAAAHVADNSQTTAANSSGSVATVGASIEKNSSKIRDVPDVKINSTAGSNDYTLVKTVANVDDNENAPSENLADRKSPLREIIRKTSRFIDKNTASRTSKKSGLLIGNIQIAFQ